MTAPNHDQRAEIERLTKIAAEAARAGQWDLVIQCYQDRGTLLEAMKPGVDQGEALLELDRDVRDHAQTTQTLLASLLSDATATRHRLQALRQRFSVPTLASETMSVKA